jgi:hypothetical protein
MPQEAGANLLQYFVSAMSLKHGRITAKLVLKVLAPKGLDSNAGTDLRLVRQRKKVLPCGLLNCGALFAERKELQRHNRVAHPATPAVQQNNPCTELGCSRTCKKVGWLMLHMSAVHGKYILRQETQLDNEISFELKQSLG